MKISIVTPTYNRENTLPKLYYSLLKNAKYNIEFEWLIIDDGSIDNTKSLIQSWIKENKISIKYYYQENFGKMAALNNIIKYTTGDIIIECDSDDYFTENAFKIITNKLEKLKKKNDFYAFIFLKQFENSNNIGTILIDNKISTMFELYYKENVTGDKSLVFNANIRKQYKYKLEKQEKFITEDKLYNEMDKKHKVICFNETIMICEYREDGYTSNILKIFKENPYGYYEYFKQLLSFDFKGVKFKKRLYIIKHYILFSYLTKNKKIAKNTNNLFNKILIYLLILPGNFKTKKTFKT